MVVRLWRGRVKASRIEEARRCETEFGIPGYLRVPGNKGVFLLCRPLGDVCEIAMLTLWDSREAIRAFAGDAIDRANYEEYRKRGLDYLIELPDEVEHFEVLATAKRGESDG